MSWCGNRSPITGECILGCPGFGGCKRGTETPAPAFVRWEAAPDRRTRPLHGAAPPVGDPFWDVEPPRDLGMFNCRGEYVIRRPRITPAWPADVVVAPAPMRGRQITPEPGWEEGALCLRNYPGEATCLGKLDLRRDDDLGGCSCFVSAPCSSCMSYVPECPRCGHREPEPC